MQEKVYFNNSKGVKLCGILSIDGKSKLVVVMCHGLSSSKDSKTYTTLEQMLNSKGISTFRFDFYGHGESEGRFEDVTVSEAVDNALAAIKFVKGRGFAKIGFIGSSFGGGANLLAAAATKDICVLALKAPVSDYWALQLGKGQRKILPIGSKKATAIIKKGSG